MTKRPISSKEALDLGSVHGERANVNRSRFSPRPFENNEARQEYKNAYANGLSSRREFKAKEYDDTDEMRQFHRAESYTHRHERETGYKNLAHKQLEQSRKK